MKKEDIKGAVAINHKAGSTTLTKEQLRNTGRAFGGVRFWIGDVLIFPDWDDIETYQNSFVGRDDKEHFFPVVKIGVNTVVREVPIGSFRRHQAGIDEYVEEYAKISDLHRNIVGAQDDFELLQVLAGKTLKVSKLFDARQVAFADGHKIPYNKDDVKTFTTQRWPVFEIL